MTTPSAEAREIAEYLFFSVFVLPRVITPDEVKRQIAQAIEEFGEAKRAEGRLKRGRDIKLENDVAREWGRQEGFAEAREMAAKVAEASEHNWSQWLLEHADERILTRQNIFIADLIRALQPPAREERG